MKRIISGFASIALFMFVSLLPHTAAAQGAQPQTTDPAQASTIESVLGTSPVGYAIIPTMKFGNTRDAIATMLGVSGGMVLPNIAQGSLMLGLGTYATVSHASLLMGYTGIVAEYTYTPTKLVHLGGSLLIGHGYASNTTTRFNTINIFGNLLHLFNGEYGIVEPEAHVEVNLSNSISAMLGVSYRVAFAYAGTERDISNQTLSGLTVNIGVRFHNP